MQIKLTQEQGIALWEATETPESKVLDEEGENMADAIVKPLTPLCDWYIYQDSTNGFCLASGDLVRRLTLEDA